ncbi:MAG: inositol 2-dehydrogenase [Spirochaetia bacterium]|jgi:myo-inositol 2-dehydrogenase/D-chiro-inositol 1-dehydrogenase
MKVGLIGAGRIGRIHAENIVHHIPRVQIARIADVAADKVRDWAKGLGITQVTTDVRELLADPEIEAVLVCSSTDTHADIVVAAAEKGKHMFCEKPVDLTVARVKKALAAVAKAKVTLQVGFNRRFDHNFRRIRDLVRQGAIGDPHILRITSRDPAPPSPEYVKVSGGIFLDMTIHDFDMARYLAGSDAVEVFAKGAVLVDPAIGKAGDVDTAVVTLTFQNGCIGVIDNSRKATYGYDQRVEVFGSKGALSCGNDVPTSVTLSNDAGVAGDKPLYFFLERYHQAFLDEMNSFFDAVIDRKPCPVGDIDGLKPLLMGLAAKKSIAEGRPVKIAEIND